MKFFYTFLMNNVILIKKKEIERCDIYNKIESANNELFYNKLQEAYSLFLEALDRAKKINDFWLEDEISIYVNNVKKKIDDLRLEKEREYKKKLELEAKEKMDKLKKIQEQNALEQENRRKRQELLRKKAEEELRELEEKRKRELEELERKKKEQEEKERKFKEEQFKKSKKEFEEIKFQYLKNQTISLNKEFLKELKNRNNNKFYIKYYLSSNIQSINFSDINEKLKLRIEKNLQNISLKILDKKINHLNIVLLGQTGVGKSTLINTILQFNSQNELKTQIGAPCTMGKPKYYESSNFKYLRLADSRGIEKDNNYRIEEVIKDITSFIKEQEINGDPDKFVHCIWYCVTSTRFEDIEVENIKKLSSLYGGIMKLPVIIVYTQSTDKQIIIDFQNKINDLNIKVIPVIAKPIPINEECSSFVPQKGLKKLIDETIECCKIGIINSYISSTKERIKLHLFKKLDQNKINIESKINNFYIQENKSYDVNIKHFSEILKNEYEKIFIFYKKIDEKIILFLQKIPNEVKMLLEILIESKLSNYIIYLNQQQSNIYKKYNGNFTLQNNIKLIKNEIKNYLQKKLGEKFEYYKSYAYVEYFKLFGFPNINSKIKEIYSIFLDSNDFMNLLSQKFLKNYEDLCEKVKIESKKLIEKLKNKPQIEITEQEKNSIYEKEINNNSSENMECLTGIKSKSSHDIKKENDEIDALFGIFNDEIEMKEEMKCDKKEVKIFVCSSFFLLLMLLIC